MLVAQCVLRLPSRLLYPLFSFLESGVSTSMAPARDPAMAPATTLGESNEFRPAANVNMFERPRFDT